MLLFKPVIIIAILAGCLSSYGQHTAIQSYLTTGDQLHLLEQQPPITFTAADARQKAGDTKTITVNSAERYQTMDGFGYCLTDGSAQLIASMDIKDREALLQELFGNKDNELAISYLRISIGASDLSDSVYSYDDMPPGQTDPGLDHFSIEKAHIHLIPLLKEIRAIQPGIKILASPWSAPSWMKTNDSTKGGSLLPKYYKTYALYFVKYLQAMKKAGIPIDAITLQNEPLNPKNNPSLYMTATEQLVFIKNYVGPIFLSHAIQTKIQLYDHNANRPDYPLTILADSAAASYVDGSAFHLYEGNISALSAVHNKYPRKNIYFTEQYTPSNGSFWGDLSWHIKEVIIGATRNWSRNVLEWNLAASPDLGPHTPGGCTTCLGALTIDKKVRTRNPSYYIIAQVSRFVPPGSVRIKSNQTKALPNVAFITPKGQKVCIILNPENESQTFNLSDQGKIAPVSLPASSVITLVW